MSRSCPKCEAQAELAPRVVVDGRPRFYHCKGCEWLFKQCLSCDALIENGELAMEEPERCEECADLVDEVDVVDDDADADLPDAFLLVWPDGSKCGRFTSAYEDAKVAAEMASRLGARVVRFVPRVRPVDLRPLLERLGLAMGPDGFSALLEGFMSSMANKLARDHMARAAYNFGRKARAKEESGLCSAARATDAETHVCSLAVGHDGSHRAVDGTQWGTP